MFVFVWKSKCDKVKRVVVSQDYLSGGLKMVNVDFFIKSLKCSWIKKLTKNNKPWLDIFLTINGSDIVNKIFDFGDAFISDIWMPKKNWYDIFTSWVHVMKNTKNEMHLKKHLFNFPVWFNSNIRMNNNSGFFLQTIV